MAENQNYLKGTTTLGLLCKDGIVLATDARATAGHMIVNKRVDKTYQISDNMVVTMAGTVSDAQLLCKLIKAELQLKKLRTDREPSVKEAANLLASMVYSNIRKFSLIPGIAHFVLGGKDETGFHLFDIYPDGSITDANEEGFVSSGSGSVFALGILETQYDKNQSVEDGINLAVTCINAALQRDSASGDGLNLVTITHSGVKKVLTKHLKQKIEV
jgi:proteasome beta subunit